MRLEQRCAIQLDVDGELHSIGEAHLNNCAGYGRNNRRRINPERRREREQPQHLLRCAADPLANKHRNACAFARTSACTEKRMQFALVDHVRTAPSPGAAGSCPVCGGAMIAKCGGQRVHHWSHRGERVCDSWWEPQTEWHRTWKSKFPVPWQEIVRFDRIGEKHIADVHTPYGLTIEFQHSHLRPEERAARENFYGSMLWVVDGSRLKRDLPRFLSQIRSFRAILTNGLYLIPFPEEAFPRSWLHCRVPVFFDFENATGLPPEMKHLTRPLWCLVPARVFGQALMLKVSREALVRSVHDKANPIPTRAILKNVECSLLLERQRQLQGVGLRAAAIATRQRHSWRRPRRFRRSSRRF
jgi:competence protein CoiA